MSRLTLEHVKPNELPSNWIKQLPAAQTFTVTIIAENWEQQPSTPEPVTIAPPSYDMRQDDNVPEDRDAYLQYLHSY